MVLQALVIGLGKIGMEYDFNLSNKNIMTHCRALTMHPDFQLLGAVDLNTEKLKNFKLKYNLPVGKNIDTLAKQIKNPDLVVLATPTESHLETLEMVFEKFSPNIVLCEKPISYDIKEAKKIIRICDREGAKLYINYIRRSEPAVKKLYSMMQDNKLGKYWHGVVFYSKGFLHSASHFHNMFLLLLGPMRISRQISLIKRLPENDFIISAEITYQRGIIQFIPIPGDHYDHYCFDIFSEKSRVSYDYGGKQVTVNSSKENNWLGNHENSFDKIQTVPNDFNRFQLHVLDDLKNAFSGKETFLFSGTEDLKSLIDIRKLFNEKKN